jgi:hypothetical protein
MQPSDALRLLSFSYNVAIVDGGPIVERFATILTDKQPWEYLLDPDIEKPKYGTFVSVLFNVVEISPHSLTQDQINDLLTRG